MATSNVLQLAVKLLRQLSADQSQGSLVSQARDCADVVQALGYYDLADYMRSMQSYDSRED